ncbi:MAG: Peptidyl-prolyl cis-trans isomerase [Myxococcaceae bacterium]|nr:Peptidyl-prolyl cis-trans isomerase [Myxococcaceae bacterium]
MPGVVVATGGRAWDGLVEADAIAAALALAGVPAASILRERCSHSTRDNARYTALMLERRGIRDVVIVTCGFHLARARVHFERAGLRVTREVSAGEPTHGLARRRYVAGREKVALFLGLALASAIGSGCSKSPPPPAPVEVVDAGGSSAAITAARAADRRRASDVPDGMRTSRDVASRRLAARALSRIADDASVDGLLRALGDDDEAVSAWGAYGLGFACKGHEDKHVAALVARAASMTATEPQTHPSGLDARTAVARAIGRCAATTSEATLVAWVRARDAWSDRAAYALGDLAGRRGTLGEESITALLEVAVGGATGPAVPAAFHPLARLPRVPDAFAPRVIEAARAALAASVPATPERIFAVRALGRSGPGAADDLGKVVMTKTYSIAERGEAARALGTLDVAGHKAAGDALAQLVPDKDPFAVMALAGGEFGVLDALVESVGSDVPKSAEAALFALARLHAPGAVPEPLARRLSVLRCDAAAALAKGAYDTEILAKCDAPGTEAFESARLRSLVRKSLVGERRAAWVALSKSKSLRLREAALDAIPDHAELADAARAALVDALRSKQGGLVATAAEIIKANPNRVVTLAASERRAALDPAAPPPSTSPDKEIDPAIANALGAALDVAWAEDLFETRMLLLEAAVAVGHKSAKDHALRACKSANVTLRGRGKKALSALGDSKTDCPAPSTTPNAANADVVAPEIDALLDHAVKVTFDTDAGALSMRFDEDLAPVTAARLVGLARAGFYKGIVMHRVVPGFVVQFGDPEGDGFGGSGHALRCETSPVPFGPLDVGMALAGRDTGSSQIFVTLSRTPHLDGEYTRVGRAEGDWSAVAQGDVIKDVHVE